MNGPTPMVSSSAKDSGTVIRSKNGRPTETCWPTTACTTTGYSVPTSTTNANSDSNRLLTMNAPSRLARDSGRDIEAIRSPRRANRMNPPPTTSTKKPSSRGPTADCEKACTDRMTEERVRKVPRMVSPNVAMTSTKFQACSMPRLTWTTLEWMNAVATSHGISAAFSTGSQAQNPPQPRTLYDHQAPTTRPALRKVQATRFERRVRRSQSTPPWRINRADIAKANGTVNPTYPR